MGQQQLLLIVLGVIVVGIAIVVGINLFNANSITANRDAVISDLNNLGSLAISHYKKPASMGGGANSFTNSNQGTAWTIPTALDTTANGTYAIGSQTPTTLTVVGTGTEDNGSSKVQATATVTASGVRVAVNN